MRFFVGLNKGVDLNLFLQKYAGLFIEPKIYQDDMFLAEMDPSYIADLKDMDEIAFVDKEEMRTI